MPRVGQYIELLDDNGMFAKVLGRHAKLIRIGQRAPRTEVKKREHNQDLRHQLAHNTFNETCIIGGLEDPNRKFKAKDKEGGKLHGGRSQTINDVMMSVMVPDTPEGVSWSPAFAALIPIESGQSAGSSTLTYFNDKKGAYTGNKTNPRRLIDGPISSLVKSIEDEQGAYFVHAYMKYELG